MSRGGQGKPPAGRGAGPAGASGLTEPLASLRAELLRLREKNARLKAARRHGDSAPLLSERTPVLEICREIERSMIVFEVTLDALAAAPIDVTTEPLV